MSVCPSLASRTILLVKHGLEHQTCNGNCILVSSESPSRTGKLSACVQSTQLRQVTRISRLHCIQGQSEGRIVQVGPVHSSWGIGKSPAGGSQRRCDIKPDSIVFIALPISSCSINGSCTGNGVVGNCIGAAAGYHGRTLRQAFKDYM